MRKQLVVIVSGLPGAGKSTLARRLGAELGLPVFDRDDLKDVMFETLGWSDHDWSSRVSRASFELLLLVMERLAAAGVSFVAETNFGAPSAPPLERMQRSSEAGWVEVFVKAEPALCAERMLARLQVGDRHPGHNPGATTPADFPASLFTRQPTGAIARIVEVDTTDGQPVDIEPILAVAEQMRRGG